MSVQIDKYTSLIAELNTDNVVLIAVSKTKPVEDIKVLYDLGQRDFGENYVQELVDKHSVLPGDIRWHFIGHLQSNKVKYIAPFVHLIHGVDSLKLLKEINKQAQKCDRVIDCLLQVHIAKEETKFGMDETEIREVVQSVPELPNIRVTGLMGMASLTDDENLIRQEFQGLTQLQNKYYPRTILSMGMSSDFRIAIEEGSTMVRIGSMLFGARSYPVQ
jgi:PLP dependent protein